MWDPSFKKQEESAIQDVNTKIFFYFLHGLCLFQLVMVLQILLLLLLQFNFILNKKIIIMSMNFNIGTYIVWCQL